MEEGTWTPEITFETPGDLSVSHTDQRGFFTRIGEIVTVTAVVAGTPTHSTAAGHPMIGGLPYEIAEGADYIPGQCILNHNTDGMTYPSGATMVLVTPYPAGGSTVAVTWRGSGYVSVMADDSPLGAANVPSGVAQKWRFTVSYKRKS